MKSIIFLLLIILSVISVKTAEEDDQLEVNILPSDKYRLNKRDLQTLQSDIERQVTNYLKLKK